MGLFWEKALCDLPELLEKSKNSTIAKKVLKKRNRPPNTNGVKKMNTELISSKKAMKQHNKLKSYWSAESRLTQKIIISMLNLLETQQISMLNLLKIQQKKKNRKPTEWNKLVGSYLKAGKTVHDASNKWKELKK